MKRVLVVAASVPILLVTAWWTLALVFTGPDPEWLRTALAALYSLGTLAILLWLRPFTWALAAWSLAFVALLVWWNTIRPSNDGDWQADVARLPQAEVRGEQLVVRNVRNFVPAVDKKASIDLLYVTNRAPGTAVAKTLPYSAERSHSMAFGTVTVELGEAVPWDTLVAQSTVSKRSVPLDLKLGPTTEHGRFPPISYGVEVTPAGLVRTPAAIDAHQKAAGMLQAEVARRLAAAPRKEVVVFVHGYANTFQDASFTMSELCHFLGREFVCAIFTWPAGGSRGLFMGYNVDRESGEFAVFHLKQALRIIADTPGVEKVHRLAHSRGTDVLTTALRELEIEAYINGLFLDSRFKVRNIVLMSPDLDLDVGVAKRFSIESDPDLPYGKAPNPRLVILPPKLRLTIYTSEGDKALSLSEFLMGSLRRLGRFDQSLLDKEGLAKAKQLAGFATFVQVTTSTGGFIGHSYFVSDPAVSADLIALIRYGLGPGDPGRPLEEISRPFWKISPRSAASN